MTHSIIWMNLEDIMLSRINQLQKDKYMIPFIWGSSQVHRNRKCNGGCLGWAEGVVLWVKSFSLLRWKSSGEGC